VAVVGNRSKAPDVPHESWPIPARIAFFGLLGAVLFFLVTEHTAHFFGALPYLLVLGCVVMHLFMHHGDGGHGVVKTGS
jgi:hypothetical protein